MEYIIVSNGIVSAHRCGKNVPEGAIPVTSFYGRIGESVKYYRDDWSRKSRIELISEGIEAMPDGFTWGDDEHTFIRELTEIEKYKTGIKEIPTGMKLVGDDLVNMDAHELYEAGVINVDEYAEIIRNERNRRIESVQWRMQRYQQQRDAGSETTDSEDWYCSALVYVQALRDVPQQPYFPEFVVWPSI